MSSVFSYDMRVQNAINFNELVSRQISNNRIYFTFGKPLAWANDAAPDQANTSVATIDGVWKNMVGAKLLTGNETKHVVPRTNWSANVVYQTYDDCLCSLKLYGPNSNFFVVTTDWNVYKCLNNSSNANSTIMPTQIYTDRAIEESDGYVWKFMYTIPVEDRIRFTTDSYMPVKYLTESDNSLQWQVQANSVAQAIESTIITNAGSGYTNANSVTVTVTGDGSGAAAIARLNTAANSVQSVILTSKGSGYTYATVTISDTGTGTNAAARAVLSPPGGHGSNALRELGGAYLILNPRLQGTENGKFPITNQFRQVNLILNPVEKVSNNLASNVAYSQFITATLDTAVTNYTEDEIVYQGASLGTASFTGVVENWDSTNSQISLTNTTGSIQSDVLIGANSGTARFVQSYTDKELQPYSGTLLYINNISPISRAADQIEDFKIVLSF
jgi:hypothetical protein